jgi:hypothetical protein
MRRWNVLALLIAITCVPVRPCLAEEATIVEVKKIWDAGQHNAFTDLTRFQDRWWCTFREAEDHVGGDGKIRVLTSTDGGTWESAALVAEAGIDLRDPKFSITPDHRLMIVAGGSVYGGTKILKGRQPRVMFSADGRTWTNPQRVLAEGDWLWRVTWHDGRAYGASYSITPKNNSGAASATPDKPAAEWALKLYQSDDGLNWSLVTPLEVAGRPNETTLRVLKTGEMVAMVRREGSKLGGMIGVARSPFKEWTWHEIAIRLGGPNFIELPNGTLVASTRDYTHAPKYTTLVGKLNRWELEPLATLPSGGDTSYAGLVWHDNLLWVSYYASHEGRTSIYLAKLKL